MAEGSVMIIHGLGPLSFSLPSKVFIGILLYLLSMLTITDYYSFVFVMLCYVLFCLCCKTKLPKHAISSSP